MQRYKDLDIYFVFLIQYNPDIREFFRDRILSLLYTGLVYFIYIKTCSNLGPDEISLISGSLISGLQNHWPSRFANGLEDLGSILGRVIPKTFKIVLDTSLLNTQQYKVRIKGEVEQSTEMSSTLPYTLV